MTTQTFHFEIQDLLIQFLAAFDNIVINRYNERARTPAQKIHVKYVYAPKQRVLYDLINPGQNLVLPVVAITMGSITRDESRVFNKNVGFLTPSIIDNARVLNDTPFFRSPVPINITVNMSIITKNQLDMDQILSNFIPYSNPYIIISWKLPEAFSPKYVQEIRTEVLWDGTVSLIYPVEINNSQKSQIMADTSFVIKGWLFPAAEKPVKNIFKVDVNMFAVDTDFTYKLSNNYTTLSSLGLSVDNDNRIILSNVISVTGYPNITDIYSENS